ncbi:Hypothetical predicted protein [Cloeon dipterum]|uniref:Uncharacterized protein n=1 Tax=Cloeon dipterum TaxID=197152 RepID=A0A8S1DYL6_9INSE|nr:Hypothetical predicted protein [Cloeon dipterum]
MVKRASFKHTSENMAKGRAMHFLLLLTFTLVLAVQFALAESSQSDTGEREKRISIWPYVDHPGFESIRRATG